MWLSGLRSVVGMTETEDHALILMLPLPFRTLEYAAFPNPDLMTRAEATLQRQDSSVGREPGQPGCGVHLLIRDSTCQTLLSTRNKIVNKTGKIPPFRKRGTQTLTRLKERLLPRRRARP